MTPTVLGAVQVYCKEAFHDELRVKIQTFVKVDFEDGSGSTRWYMLPSYRAADISPEERTPTRLGELFIGPNGGELFAAVKGQAHLRLGDNDNSGVVYGVVDDDTALTEALKALERLEAGDLDEIERAEVVRTGITRVRWNLTCRCGLNAEARMETLVPILDALLTAGVSEIPLAALVATLAQQHKQ